jgi:hypothetical protein
MVPSGQPTQDMIDQLVPLVSQGDLLIDGGNSKYTDDIIRRAVQHGSRIGLETPFLGRLQDVVIETLGDLYPDFTISTVGLAPSLYANRPAANGIASRSIHPQVTATSRSTPASR